MDYGRADETELNPSLRYKAQSFLPVIDQFTASLDQRLQAYKLLADRYDCFGCLSTLSPEELLTAAKTLVECYPNIWTIHSRQYDLVKLETVNTPMSFIPCY